MKNIILIISVFTTFLIAEKWEYCTANKMDLGKIINKQTFDSSCGIQYDLTEVAITTEMLMNQLNMMGSDGWELISVNHQTEIDYEWTEFYFKRKVLEPIIKK
ncbi:MAG: hypothetical protein HOA66_06730 [Candidatus Marinimicrobia bacterium]|jgi:hypothetical protein|nr:hypothetical protein [Candidatus Neomarinimicrobiota bacterium]